MIWLHRVERFGEVLILVPFLFCLALIYCRAVSSTPLGDDFLLHSRALLGWMREQWHALLRIDLPAHLALHRELHQREVRAR
jgi:hypothetical protein